MKTLTDIVKNNAGKICIIGSLLFYGFVGFYVVPKYIEDNKREAFLARVRKRNPDCKLSLEDIYEYEELGASYVDSDDLYSTSITPERVKILLGEGIDYEKIYYFASAGGGITEQVDTVWPKYEKFRAEGFTAPQSVDYIIDRVPIERAIEWRNADERVQKLIHLDNLTLGRATELAAKYDVDDLVVYLESGTNPSVVDVVIDRNPGWIYTGDGGLNPKEFDKTLEEYRWGLLNNLKDKEIEFCWLNNRSLKEAKKWKKAGLTVEEMHKQKTIYKLLTEQEYTLNLRN